MYDDAFQNEDEQSPTSARLIFCSFNSLNKLSYIKIPRFKTIHLNRSLIYTIGAIYFSIEEG